MEYLGGLAASPANRARVTMRMHMKTLENRIALITGATRGLGKAIALELAAAGAKLALVGRDEAKVSETAQEAVQIGAEAHVFVTDVAQEHQVQALKRRTQEHFGRVDIFVNNAGVMLRKPLVDCSVEEWRKVIDSNLTSVFLM